MQNRYIIQRAFIAATGLPVITDLSALDLELEAMESFTGIA
jgi:hypothetical protein